MVQAAFRLRVCATRAQPAQTFLGGRCCQQGVPQPDAVTKHVLGSGYRLGFGYRVGSGNRPVCASPQVMHGTPGGLVGSLHAMVWVY